MCLEYLKFGWSVQSELYLAAYPRLTKGYVELYSVLLLCIAQMNHMPRLLRTNAKELIRKVASPFASSHTEVNLRKVNS